jgi:hypothetical protein
MTRSLSELVDRQRLLVPRRALRPALPPRCCDPEQTDRFFGTIAGTVPIPEFFAPENVGRIVGAGATPAPVP